MSAGAVHWGMIETENRSKFKLAALDLDGTLLGPDGTISPANRAAVMRLQQAGLQVVLASGRHFSSMLPYARALPGIHWIVSSQGGEVADCERTVVLTGAFMPHLQVCALFQLGRTRGCSPVAFGVDGVVTTAPGNPDLEFFTALDGHEPVACKLEQLANKKIFKVLWVGDPQDLDQYQQSGAAVPEGIQAVRTNARFLEFLPATVSKAAGLETLGRRLGIRAAESITFGDGDNDVPMFEWAGLSVAMPHGWPAALASAAHVAPPGAPDTALARGINLLFARGYLPEPVPALSVPIPIMAGT